MKKYPILLILFSFFFDGVSQNVTVVVKRKCAADKSSEVKEAVQKFKTVLNELVDEGKLINATVYSSSKGDSIECRELLVLASESNFPIFKNEYESRLDQQYSALNRAIIEGCKRKDTIIHQPKLYPVVKSDFWSYVMPVKGIDETPDPKLNYNVVFDFTTISKVGDTDRIDSTEMNWGLGAIGRMYNLHAGAGIPPKKINFVLAVHAWSIYSFLSNDEYQKKYKTDNPNLRIIKELHDAGVKFLVCGQAMNWLKIDKAMLVPEAKVTLTAQTTLTSYQMKGYASIPMKND
jgi:intracellular sulfur oxidation DsrE/DsrF family protein